MEPIETRRMRGPENPMKMIGGPAALRDALGNLITAQLIEYNKQLAKDIGKRSWYPYFDEPNNR